MGDMASMYDEEYDEDDRYPTRGIPAAKKAKKRRKVKPESARAPVQQYAYSPWVQRLNKVFFPDGQFIEPLSERWRQARRGRLTASKRAEIIYNRRPAEWNALADEIEHELSPEYQWTEARGKALDWGRDHEKQAIANIELDYGRDVGDPGLLFHTEHPWIAATPDGLVTEGRKRISVQIKCPYNPRNHLDTLYNKTLRPVYFYQVQWEGMVSGADEIEFYSFDPRQPLATRLVQLKIPVQQEVVDRLYTNALEFGHMIVTGSRMATGSTTPEGVILPYGG